MSAVEKAAKLNAESEVRCERKGCGHRRGSHYRAPGQSAIPCQIYGCDCWNFRAPRKPKPRKAAAPVSLLDGVGGELPSAPSLEVDTL